MGLTTTRHLVHLLFRRFSAVPYAQAKVDKLGADLAGQLKAMKTVVVTKADFEAMKREVALKTKELEGKGKEVTTKDQAVLDLQVL